MKKLLLGLSGALVTALPLATFVACSSNETETPDTENPDTENPDTETPEFNEQGVLEVDVDINKAIFGDANEGSYEDLLAFLQPTSSIKTKDDEALKVAKEILTGNYIDDIDMTFFSEVPYELRNQTGAADSAFAIEWANAVIPGLNEKLASQPEFEGYEIVGISGVIRNIESNYIIGLSHGDAVIPEIFNLSTVARAKFDDPSHYLAGGKLISEMTKEEAKIGKISYVRSYFFNIPLWQPLSESPGYSSAKLLDLGFGTITLGLPMVPFVSPDGKFVVPQYPIFAFHEILSKIESYLTTDNFELIFTYDETTKDWVILPEDQRPEDYHELVQSFEDFNLKYKDFPIAISTQTLNIIKKPITLTMGFVDQNTTVEAFNAATIEEQKQLINITHDGENLSYGSDFTAKATAHQNDSNKINFEINWTLTSNSVDAVIMPGLSPLSITLSNNQKVFKNTKHAWYELPDVVEYTIPSTPSADLTTTAVYTPNLSTYTNNWLNTLLSKDWETIWPPTENKDFFAGSSIYEMFILTDQNGIELTSLDQTSLGIQISMQITRNLVLEQYYAAVMLKFTTDGFGVNNISQDNVLTFASQSEFNTFTTNADNKGQKFFINPIFSNGESLQVASTYDVVAIAVK